MTAPSIVTVQVSVLTAPTPSTLQQTGAFISMGATTWTPGTFNLITEMADLTPHLVAAAAVSTAVFDTDHVDVATTAPHGLTVGETVLLTFAGFTPTGYNGTFLCTIDSASTLHYAQAVDPGATSVVGTWVVASKNELISMATTFFAQGTISSVYVLELGPTSVTEAVAALAAWLTANPLTIYSFLVPRSWDNDASFLALLALYESNTSMTYFWVTTTSGTYTSYTATMKDVIALVEAPTVVTTATTEFSLAGPFYHSLSFNPSPTNRVPPFAFSYAYGVTAYPTVGNSALLNLLKAASINVIGTGAEGGISQTMIYWGTTKDGRDFLYWWSVDYTQIYAKINLTNEVINGSNNPVNPLYYDQQGINRLQARLAQQMNSEIAYGLAVGTVVQTELSGQDFQAALNANSFSAQAVINAIPFVSYTTANPSDYRIGRYAGLSLIYIPTRGFEQILVNLVVSDFVTF